MKKVRYLIILILQTVLVFSQQKDENLFFKLKNDTILFYFDEAGSVTTKVNARYYRTSFIDTLSFNFSGDVNDYYINGLKAFECNYYNKLINGNVNSFYNNGQIKYKGYFKHSQKDSTWHYYYENGVIEKIIHYKKDMPNIKECYKKNGKVIFADGNGKYTGKIITLLGNNQPVDCVIKGEVINGAMEGWWNWNCTRSQGDDYFKNGQYIKSETYGLSNGPVPPRGVFLTGFDVHENVKVFEFIALPRENSNTNGDVKVSNVPVRFKSSDFESLISPKDQLRYKQSNNLNREFSKDISDYLLNAIKENGTGDFWCFIQFVVNSDNGVNNILIHSNNSLISIKINQFLSGIKEFEAVKIDRKPISSDVYLSINFQSGQLYIPEYNFNNLGINPLYLFKDN